MRECRCCGHTRVNKAVQVDDDTQLCLFCEHVEPSNGWDRLPMEVKQTANLLNTLVNVIARLFGK